MRTSTGVRFVLPTRWISRRSSARRSLGWRSRRELADLVEEQRAAVRRLERAGARGDGAGERAGLVTEQLALEEVAGDRAAVDDDERPVAPRAREVDRLGRDVLAGAASRRASSTVRRLPAARSSSANEARIAIEPPTSRPNRSRGDSATSTLRVADLEPQLRAAEREQRTVAQRRFDHRHAVDVRTVAAPEVVHASPPALDPRSRSESATAMDR